MNIKELNGRSIKKSLNANRVHFQWHNRNNSGGNFGINIRGLKGADFEISGDYDRQGTIHTLHFGYLCSLGIRMFEDTFEKLMNSINEIVVKIDEKKTAIVFKVNENAS